MVQEWGQCWNRLSQTQPTRRLADQSVEGIERVVTSVRKSSHEINQIRLLGIYYFLPNIYLKHQRK